MTSQATAWLGVFGLCMVDAVYFGILECYVSSCGHFLIGLLAAYQMYETAEDNKYAQKD